MNPAEQSKSPNAQAPAPGIGLEDVLFTLFRHKWLILGFTFLGIVGAAVVRYTRPPLYVSTAKLMVHYVVERGSVNPADQEGRVLAPEVGAQNIISSEIEILKSLDVATNVVELVGAEKLLARLGGGNNRMAAAGVVFGGIEVENPARTTMLSVSYKHRDAKIVRPTLQALIDAYRLKHNQVHGIGGEVDAYYASQCEELQKKIARTEDELKKIKTANKVVSVEEAKRVYQTQIAKWEDELLTAQKELAERKAMLGNEAAGGSTNAPEGIVPFEKISDYTFARSQLESLKANERELRLKYTTAYPLLQTVENQIEKLTQEKADLEKQFPALVNLAASGSRSHTNSPGADLAADLAEVRRLSGGVAYIQMLLTNLQQEASRVLELEPTIKQLELQRDLDQTNYHYLSTVLHQAMISKSLGPGNMINMSIVQYPTPTARDTKKLKKLVMSVLFGCAGCGLGLAFLIDFFIDRSIKRAVDVERHLRLRVLLTIPHTSWTRRRRLPWSAKSRGSSEALADSANGNGNGNGHAGTAVARWNPVHHLQSYTEGLRERILTYFEINKLNLKKPKLVGVTACAAGSGVTTLAGGLAAALSKTGTGNVLLVDMNDERGLGHSFHNGKPGCGLEEVLEAEHRADAQVHDNLYVASVQEEKNDQLVKAVPTGLSCLIPKIKGSDYDYIIFDMPPVTQTSATPRLASHMDLVLLVLESEKTGQQPASQATALMRESRANVAAVLNKYRPRVPARLSQEM